MILRDELVKLLDEFCDSSSKKLIWHIKRHKPDIYCQLFDYKNKFNHTKLVESIYVIINGSHNLCEYNINKRTHQFISFEQGYSQFCSNTCFCRRQFQSNNLTKRHQNMSLDEKLTLLDKCKQTNLKKLGVEYPAQSIEIQNKMKQTCVDRYKVESFSQTEEFNKKYKLTNLRHFGVEYPAQSIEIQNKMKKTCVDRHGYEFHAQQHLSLDVLDILKDKDKFTNLVTGKAIREVAKTLTISNSSVLVYAKKYNCRHLFVDSTSMYEIMIKDLLDSLNIKYIHNSKLIIPPKQLDFYIPKFNLAIEPGSSYFHTEMLRGRGKFYHYDKWQQCYDKGITLLQYFDNDLINYFHLIKYKIKQLCNIESLTFNIDNLQLTQITDNDSILQFLNEYHSECNFNDYNLAIGAYTSDQLIAISTWLIKDDYLELVNFANDIEYKVDNLLPKLISKIKSITNSNRLVVYTDNRYDNGIVYKNIGFERTDIIDPKFTYTKTFIDLESPEKYQKENLAEIFSLDQNYVNSKTEWEIMQEQGYDRLWDAGKTKWVLNI